MSGGASLEGLGRNGAWAGQRWHDLPDGWIWSTIGEIACDITSGFACGEHNTDGKGVPHLRPMNISPTGVIDLSFVRYVEESGHDALRKGDVLFNNTNSPAWLGKTACVQTDTHCAYSNHMTRIRLRTGVVPAWLAYYLHYLFQTGFFRMHCRHHVNQASINTTFLSESVLIPLAPVSEQQRIVDLLEAQFTRIDAAVAALKRAKATLRHYRASVLQAACEGRLVPTEAELARQEGRAYEPADELLQRILEARWAKWEEERWEYEIERAKKKAAQADRKAAGLPYYIRDLEPEHWEHRTPEEYEPYLPKGDQWKEKYDEPEPPDTDGLPELPDGWVWASVDQLAFNIQYGHTESAADQPVGPRFLRITDIQDGRVDWEAVPYCHCPPGEREKYSLECGDIVFARTGATTGKSYLIKHPPSEAIFASYLIRLQLNKGVDPAFLDLFFGSPIYWPQIMTVRKGSAQPGVNATILATLTVPLPPLAEQRCIVQEAERRFSVVDALKNSVEANLSRAQRLRQAILKKAFEGRLVPQDPDDEPASVLLERITGSRKAAKPAS